MDLPFESWVQEDQHLSVLAADLNLVLSETVFAESGVHFVPDLAVALLAPFSGLPLAIRGECDFPPYLGFAEISLSSGSVSSGVQGSSDSGSELVVSGVRGSKRNCVLIAVDRGKLQNIGIVSDLWNGSQ